MNKPFLIAHRGDAVNFSENSIDSFKSAFDHYANGVELDTQLHQGKLIVVHGYLFDPKKVYPSLKSVLDTFSERGRVEIEVKSFSSEIIKPLFELKSC